MIVGVIDGAMVPSWYVSLRATMPSEQWGIFQRDGGRLFPAEQVDAARRELEELVRILEAEGVTVRRPEVTPHDRPFATPTWSSPGGLYAAMLRDVLLVVGDELIEAPMCWRSRYYEINPCRPLLKGYFLGGARWWVSMNVLMLDRERVIVERHEEPLIRALTEWGVKPIPCNFRNFNRFGGSFHCATLDVRRRGSLESYF